MRAPGSQGKSSPSGRSSNERHIPMNTRYLLGFVLLLLGALPACGSTDCDLAKDQDSCESGVAHACIDKGFAKEWVETACTGTPAPACVTGQSGGRTVAFCAV